jgi:hypothetical protein
MVVKETTYWQSRGSNPQSVMTSFTRLVNSEEQPYVRTRLKVSEEWQSLDTGWLKKSSMVIVENLPEVRQTIPTPEQLKAAKGKVLEIAVTDDAVVIPLCHVQVGESVRLVPPYGKTDRFRLRCLSGATSITVTAFPGDQ